MDTKTRNDQMQKIMNAVASLVKPDVTPASWDVYIASIKYLAATMPAEKGTLGTDRYGVELDDIKAKGERFQFDHGVLMIERLWIKELIKEDDIPAIVGEGEYKIMMSYHD